MLVFVLPALQFDILLPLIFLLHFDYLQTSHSIAIQTLRVRYVRLGGDKIPFVARHATI